MTIYLLVAREKTSLQTPIDDLAYTEGSGFYVCAKAAQSIMVKCEEWTVLLPVYAFFLFLSIVLWIPGKAIKS